MTNALLGIRLLIAMAFLVGTGRYVSIGSGPRRLAAPEDRLEHAIAFERGGDIWTRNPDGAEIRVVKGAISPAWSPDGTKLAFISDSALSVVEMKRRTKIRKLWDLPISKYLSSAGPDNTERPSLSWHPSGRHIAIAVPETLRMVTSGGRRVGQVTLASIWVVPVEGRNGRVRPYEWISPVMRGWDSVGALGATYPSWSPDGRRLAFSRGLDVWIAQVRGGMSAEEATTGDWDWSQSPLGWNQAQAGGSGGNDVMGVGAFSWHPAGNRVAYEFWRWNGGSYRRVIVRSLIRNPATSPERRIDDAMRPAFCPDGRRLLFVRYERIGALTSAHSGMVACIYSVNVSSGRETLVASNADAPAVCPVSGNRPANGTNRQATR